MSRKALALKRLEILKAAPLGLVAACTGRLTPSGSQQMSSLVTPLCTGKLWKFDKQGNMSKSGGHTYSTAYHKQGPSCGFVQVGGFELDFLINKGGAYVRENITFWAGNNKQIYRLSDLESIFYPGAVVQLFKKWYFKVNKKGTGGTLYDNNNNALSTCDSDKYFTKTSITMNGLQSGSASGGGGDTWDYDWGQTWQNYGSGSASPNISIGCAGALAVEFGCSVGWVISAIGSFTGPLDWFAFAGLTAGLFGSAALVLSECNK